MKHIRQNIWEENEYSYAAAYGFVPNIRTYLHEEDDSIRDCMLVVPGGGYCMVVPSEAEIVAKEFYNRGMNAFVLTYTTDITMSVPLKKQPLYDISRAVRYIRANSAEYHINPERLYVCGFSAGAHVCGTLATHFDDVNEENPKYAGISNRPDAAILSYPVITTGEFTHIYSVWALVGQNAPQEEMDYFSLEKNVTPDTPPCFIWQTVEDNLVPIENSYLMAKSLRENKVPYAQYAFPKGFHGLSVPNKDFFTGNHGEPYTFEQVNLAVENVKNRTAVNVSEHRREELMIQFFGNKDGIVEEKKEDDKPPVFAGTEEIPADVKDVRMWPELAQIWLTNLFSAK